MISVQGNFLYYLHFTCFSFTVNPAQRDPALCRLSHLRSPRSADFWRSCELNGGTQRHGLFLTRHQRHENIKYLRRNISHNLSRLQSYTYAPEPRLASNTFNIVFTISSSNVQISWRPAAPAIWLKLIWYLLCKCHVLWSYWSNDLRPQFYI